MSQKDPLHAEYVTMKFIMDGKTFLIPRAPVGATAPELKEIGAKVKSVTLRVNELTREGVITGWTPILSEVGAKRWAALKAMFEEP